MSDSVIMFHRSVQRSENRQRIRQLAPGYTMVYGIIRTDQF